MVALPSTSGHDQNIAATQDDRDGWSLSGRPTEQEDPRMSQPAIIKCERRINGSIIYLSWTSILGRNVTDEMEMSGR